MAAPYSAHPSSFKAAKMIIIIGFAFSAYMLYALTVEMYQNYQIDRHIAAFEQKNNALLQENAKKIENLQYYTSDAYIEKIAKQSLGLINPGEEVIILPLVSDEMTIDVDFLENSDLSGLSNFSKWWRFFFVENKWK